MNMEQPKSTRQANVTLIDSLERQIAALEQLTGHETEIDACKRAVERLNERLEEIPQS